MTYETAAWINDVILVNPKFPLGSAEARDVQGATRSLGMRFNVLFASTEGEIDAAFTDIVRSLACFRIAVGGRAVLANLLGEKRYAPYEKPHPFVWSYVVAPRAYWKGYLKLSLVSCPVALFPASSERERISFNQINKIRKPAIALDIERWMRRRATRNNGRQPAVGYAYRCGGQPSPSGVQRHQDAFAERPLWNIGAATSLIPA